MFKKHLGNLWKDLIKDKNILDGERLEDYACDFFFPPDLYNLIHRSHDVNTNSKRFVESSLWPDFWFRIKGTNTEFRVEVKLRNNRSDNNYITFFKEGQRDRYKKFPNTFLFLCTYVNDDYNYFLIPLSAIKYDGMYVNQLQPFHIKYDPPILPGLITKYIN